MYEFETGKITTVEHIHFENDLKILQKNIDAHLFDVTVLKNAYEDNMS
jgi:hypothetical protein